LPYLSGHVKKVAAGKLEGRAIARVPRGVDMSPELNSRLALIEFTLTVGETHVTCRHKRIVISEFFLGQNVEPRGFFSHCALRATVIVCCDTPYVAGRQADVKPFVLFLFWGGAI
jgi:hypothetical protein